MTAATTSPSLVLSSLTAVHQAWAWVLIVGNGVAGLWALGAAWKPPLRVKYLWWFTAFAQLAAVVEVGMGVWLFSVDNIPAPRFHAFYGFLTVIAAAVIYSYRVQMQHRLYLLYGLGGLFIMGLGIRAVVVG